MSRYFNFYILFFVFLLGCQKTFEFPKEAANVKMPVIEAIITDYPDRQKVRLSYTTAFDDSISSSPITNASVKIASENGDTVQFYHSDNGWYTCNNLIIVPKKLYSLLVKIDTVTYRASSSIIPIHGLDSVTYSFYQKEDSNEPAYYLKLYGGITSSGETKYFQLHLYKNNQLITYGTNIILASDLAMQSLDGIELDNPFARDDTIDVELYSLSKGMFYYYQNIYNSILINVNYDLEFNTNPPIQFSPKALGYFQLSALSRKRIIIQ